MYNKNKKEFECPKCNKVSIYDRRNVMSYNILDKTGKVIGNQTYIVCEKCYNKK